MGYGEKGRGRIVFDRWRLDVGLGAGLVSAEQFQKFHAPVLRCPHSLETAETAYAILTASIMINIVVNLGDIQEIDPDLRGLGIFGPLALRPF